MDPQPPLIGKAPKVKVIIVTDTVNELEKLLADKFKIAASYPHAKGAIFLLIKE